MRAVERARERRAERKVAAAFGVTMLSGGALLVVYLLGGQPQVEGLLLLLCLGGIGVGLVLWSHDLMPIPIQTEARHSLASEAAQRQLLTDVDESGVSRRKLLVRMLFGAIAGLGAALLVPVLSLGPAPGRALFTTSWRQGSRVVNEEGRAINADELAVGSIFTVFPEGAAGSADSQAVLIRVDPALLQLPAEQLGWAPDGYIVYSKLCTHAGCPVGLYRAQEQRLICPCHQSAFDVLRGAVPVFGPAARALPQLPIRREPDGTFTALGDFPEPAGPSFWNMTHDG